MNIVCPLALYRYIRHVSQGTKRFSYLKLDSQHCAVEASGELSRFGLDQINVALPIDQQFLPLFGMLPVTGQAVTLVNVNLNNKLFVDIHIIPEGLYQWIAIIDKTEEGRVQQAKQQSVLNSDLLREQSKLA